MQMPNVVLAGHVASFTQQAASNMMTAVVAGLIAVAEGRLPAGCVNAEGLKRGRFAPES
jgi:phosphoglycerate dehydrogenase-like enzyme